MSADSPATDTSTVRTLSRAALLGLVLAGVALALGIAAGFGTRWGWWDFRLGFRLLSWAAYVAIAALAVSLTGVFVVVLGRRRRGLLAALAGLIVAAVVVAVPLQWLRAARSVPAIHDITTDTSDPPGFVAILPLRAGAPNPAVYGGPAVAEQQHQAYPDIASLPLPLPPARAFDRALARARTMGWEIVAADPASGRIEAVATTFWFGFKDDVVIRIRAEGAGSRLDVRSVSRVGKSDVGTNAARIRKYLSGLQAGA